MSNILSLEFQSMDVYSLAVLNNSIPLIDEIIIKNDCEYNIKNLELEIFSSPSFFAPFTKKISDVSSGRYVIINNCDLDIDVTKLMYAAKAITATLTVRIKNSGETLASASKSVLLLPFDYIPPVSVYSELISSFVTPSQREIEGITVSVEEKLRNRNDIPVNRESWSLDDKTVSETVIQAIYETLKDLKITFNNFSVSSKNSPFKIKLPEITLLTRNGNSFEIALLLCSIAESLRLRPFIVITIEKVLVGIFYTQDCFDTCVCDDVRCFKNMTDGKSDRFCLIDTTSIVSGVNVTFKDSLLTAQKALDRCERPLVIDIYRSRISGYRSLPDRVHQNGDIIFEPSQQWKKKVDEKNPLDFSLFDSPHTFSAFLRDRMLSKNEKEKLNNIDVKKSVFLIGGAKYIISKLIINGKILLKQLPLNDIINDKTDFFSQLSHINKNINITDMSGMVNCIHSKESLNQRVLSIIEDCKKENSAISLEMGTLCYNDNGNRMCAPLFFVTVDFELDSQHGVFLKLVSSKISVNTAVVSALSKRGINTSIYSPDDDLFDKYDDIVKSFAEDLEGSGFEYFDTVIVSAINIDGQSLTSIATPDYFKKSTLLSKVFSGTPLDCNVVDRSNLTESLSMPFSLDSSQSYAVRLASNNECTIIKGANGSGKTLVSASIAFSEISKGKKVLYVTDSDSNISDFIGYAKEAEFSDYVMQISENSKIVNVFDMSVYNAGKQDATYFEGTEKRLLELVAEQDQYYKSLHKVNEIGFSLYEAASQYERYRSFPYSVNFSNEEISKLSRNDVVLWLDGVSSIAKAGADCKEPFSNPLSLIKEKNFSYDFKSRAMIALNAHSCLTKSFLSAQEQLTEFLGIEVSILKEKQTIALIKMLECITKYSEIIYHGIFSRESIESDFSRIDSLTLQCDDLFELKDFVMTNFTHDVITLDCEAILTEWRNALSKFAFSRSASLNAAKNRLKGYCIDPKFITNDNFTETVSKIARYKASLSAVEDCASLIYQVTGVDIRNALELNESDIFLRLKETVNVSQKYLSLIMDVYDSEKTPSSVYAYQSSLFKNSSKLLNDITLHYGDFESLYYTYVNSEKELAELLKIDLHKAKEANHKIWYYYVNQLLDRMIDNIDLLKYWCNWNVEKEKAIAIGLDKVITLYESEQMSSSDLKNAFLKGFFKSVTEYFLSCEDSVSKFTSDLQNEKMSEFYVVLDKYRRLLYSNLKNKISNNFTDFCQNQLHISVEEAEMALKKNFSYAIDPTADSGSVKLLQVAKPCFVCRSPKFLGSFKNLPDFDTVIVDISSDRQQNSLFMLLPITKKVVIIDTDSNSKNQVRFSNIFTKLGAPIAELNWLYTSNFASHITNELFYHNSLTTFISSKKIKNGVNIIRQSGVYDSKNTRVNVIEASAVVDEMIRIRNDSPRASVGVYAMTDEQRSLIELLYVKRKNYQHYDKSENGDSLFIRSLEQGEYDTRDFIIFSTVISTDEKSKYSDYITKSIPELADESGITALENALLSARKELTVITSLDEKELTEFKTTERGYCLFKKMMLRLLSDNTLSLQDVNLSSFNENPIIREVSNHIESLGYKVELNLGINKCKIDVAIKNKGENSYSLGIIFDESVYLNGEDFIGRDLLLRSLEEIGQWKLLRIYTVDWFENHSKQLDMITSVLNGDSFKKIFK